MVTAVKARSIPELLVAAAEGLESTVLFVSTVNSMLSVRSSVSGYLVVTCDSLSLCGALVLVGCLFVT